MLEKKDMDITPEMQQKLEGLRKKYAAMGQNMESYLDGLLYADYLTYWEYIHLDSLLSLQTPKTPIPDEEIFILYHQITELYFKLIIKALRQLINEKDPTEEFVIRQMKRANSYFDQLINSFGIMVEGMDKDEFLKFRMSLLPASGFQSGQYRMIEFISTDVSQLVHYSQREQVRDESTVEELYDLLYWKSGATELATGKKTLTLKQFEAKYRHDFFHLMHDVKSCNLRQLVKQKMSWINDNPNLKKLFREYDLKANVRWPLMHYKSAVRYLDQKPKHIEATGGTNWQKYLPPKNQGIVFFPELWSEEEISKWGTFGLQQEQ